MEQSEVPAASPNRQACEGRTREGNGGVGSAQAYHMEGWKWERERGGSRAWRSVAQAKGCGRQWPPTVGRRRRCCCADRGERRGWATRRCATNRWGQAATGPDGQRQDAGGREVSKAMWRHCADRRPRPAQRRAARFEYNSNSNKLKLLKNLPNIDRSKNSLP
jgi:hypothetical protein